MFKALFPQSEGVLIAAPYRHDRITVTGRRFTGKAPGSHMTAVFDTPSEPVALSLIGEFHCEYRSGPNLRALANRVGELIGPGFYGLESSRYLGFH